MKKIDVGGGGGVKVLVARPLRKYMFLFTAPLSKGKDGNLKIQE